VVIDIELINPNDCFPTIFNRRIFKKVCDLIMIKRYNFLHSAIEHISSNYRKPQIELSELLQSIL